MLHSITYQHSNTTLISVCKTLVLSDLITRVGLLRVSWGGIALTSGMSCHFEGTSVLTVAV